MCPKLYLDYIFLANTLYLLHAGPTKTAPLLISIIEMRALWTEVKYIKTVKQILCQQRALDLSKEVLWVSVGQRTAELPAVKVQGKKKICRLAKFEPASPASGQLAQFLF